MLGTSKLAALGTWLQSTLIGQMPTGYTFRQKWALVLSASPLGRYWDILQVRCAHAVFFFLVFFVVTVSLGLPTWCRRPAVGVATDCPQREAWVPSTLLCTLSHPH